MKTKHFPPFTLLLFYITFSTTTIKKQLSNEHDISTTVYISSIDRISPWVTALSIVLSLPYCYFWALTKFNPLKKPTEK